MAQLPRLDLLLVRRGLSPSRSRAADAIRRGHVRVGGEQVVKPGAMVDEGAQIEIVDPASGYVSRGALKLAHALDTFGIDPAGQVCLDTGASTGGFTQLLLERGALRLHAIDVGHGQLADVLRHDPRVHLQEGVNARDLTLEQLGERAAIIVVDVSFISLRLVLPAVLAVAAPGARLVALVKPQFEVGREGLGKGGIVRNDALADAALAGIVEFIDALTGWRVTATTVSPIEGGDGNREFLLAAEFTAPGKDL